MNSASGSRASSVRAIDMMGVMPEPAAMAR